MTWLGGLIGLPLMTSPMIYLSGQRKSVWFNPVPLSLLLLAALWGVLMGMIGSESPMFVSVEAISLRMDGLSLLMTVLVLVLATAIVLFSIRDIGRETGTEKYYAMVFILTGMLIGMVCAQDLFNLWMWFEGTAISSYMLVAFYQNHENALRASIKYFVQTATGSILILFAIALVFLQIGTLNMIEMQAEPSLTLIVAGAFFAMGFGVKAALFPNYTWLPDAYAESPTGISALLSGVVTVTGLVVLLKVLSPLIDLTMTWGILLLVIASLNIVAGNLLALAQTQVKRILAYSSVSHIGYIVLAVAMGMISQSLPGMRGAVLHLFVHGLMKSLGFLAVGVFVFALGRSNISPLTVQDLNGAAQRYPVMALALVISLLSLGGVPPFAGFISKWQIFTAGVDQQSVWMMGVMVFVAVNSVISLAYYLPILNALYTEADDSRWQTTADIPPSMRFPVMVLAIALLVLGLLPQLLNGLIDPAAAALLALFV